MSTNPVCPVCGKAGTGFWHTSEGREIFNCTECGFKFLHPSPTERELNEFYTKGYFEGERSGAMGYKNYKDLEANLKKEAEMKLDYIGKWMRKGKILDLGAGTGVFLEEARGRGYEVAGNDISDHARKELGKRKIKCYQGPIEKGAFPKQEFDVVTAWDVIEHVVKVRKMVEVVRGTLKKGGLLFMTTPDTESWDARLMGKKWYGYKKIPEHVGFFNRKSMTELLAGGGFEAVEIRAWGFVRNLGFVTDKLRVYGKVFSALGGIADKMGLGEMSGFIPMTDFMVVGRKR